MYISKQNGKLLFSKVSRFGNLHVNCVLQTVLFVEVKHTLHQFPFFVRSITRIAQLIL